MTEVDSKRQSFKESLERMREKRSTASSTPGAPAETLSAEMTSRIRDWETILDERLSAYRAALGQAVLPAFPSRQPAVVSAESPLQQWVASVERTMLAELGFDRFPLPAGFHPPVRFVDSEEAMRGLIARACGSEWQVVNGRLPGVLHLPGQGTVVNRAYYLEGNTAPETNDIQTYARFAADMAHERWGWGFLLEYTALGQAAGKAGLWPALVADRFGLPGSGSAESGKARALRQIWMLTEAGWEDWVWQYVMFKARHPIGEHLFNKPRPGRMFELVAKILDLFPFYVVPFGLKLRLRNLLDLLSFLFLEQGEVIPRSLNSVLVITQGFCLQNDEAITGTAGMRLSQMLGRFYFSQLEAHVGILATSYAALIACHNERLDFRKMKDGAALLAQAEKDPRANPDTRLALLSNLDARVKYDSKAMATAAWERLRLEGPREYFV